MIKKTCRSVFISLEEEHPYRAMIEIHSPILKAFEPKFKLSFSYLLKVVGRFSRPEQFLIRLIIEAQTLHWTGAWICYLYYSVASVFFFRIVCRRFWFLPRSQMINFIGSSSQIKRRSIFFDVSVSFFCVWKICQMSYHPQTPRYCVLKDLHVFILLWASLTHVIVFSS